MFCYNTLSFFGYLLIVIYSNWNNRIMLKFKLNSEIQIVIIIYIYIDTVISIWNNVIVKNYEK